MDIKETKVFHFHFIVQRIGKDGNVQQVNYDFDTMAENKKEALKLVMTDLNNVIAQADEEFKKM